MDEIIKVKKGIKHIAKGQEHDLKEDFTRQSELLPNHNNYLSTICL